MASVFERPSPKLGAAAAAMEHDDPGALDAALDDLGDDDWAELERIIGTAATRTVRSSRSRQASLPPSGEVILLPGIMGTDLGVVDSGGVPRVLWFNLLALRNGGLAKLRLPVDGSVPAEEVVVGGPLKLFYLPLQMTLNRRWRTHLFPYDWRLDLATTADRLAAAISRIGATRVHLVAHSMGGLVCRTMIARHPELWARMDGRLVMLGTPNRGSFAPVLALAGKDRKLRLLALLDGHLSSTETVEIVATFPGLVQMLPSVQAGLEPSVEPLFGVDGWPGAAVRQELLDRARQTHDLLHDVVDPERMVYIAGDGHLTIDGVQRDGDRFRWRRSRAGDGTVPHSLGPLPGVATYWTPTKHGSLPKDDAVLAAIDELLETGSTERLIASAEPPSARGRDDAEWVDDTELELEVDDAVTRSHARGRDLDLLDDVLPAVSSTGVQVPIKIEVVWGRIGSTDADMVVVGHYQDVYPTAAELALDEALSGVKEDRRRMLHAATARGVLKGMLGDVFLVPWERGGGRRSTAAVLGLGRPGTFKLAQHEVLVRNMVWTAERMVKATSIASVLVGAGAGNLSIEDVIGNLVRALDVAVKQSEMTGHLQLIRIVELELGRARKILDVLRRVVGGRDRSVHPAVVDVVQTLCEEGGDVSVETALSSIVNDLRGESDQSLAERVARIESSELAREAILAALARRAEASDESYRVTSGGPSEAMGVPTRLSVLAVGGALVGSAVSDSATVPERDFGLSVELFTQLVDLANSQAAGNPDVAGRMLLRVAIRPEFRPLLTLDRDVIIEVDRTTAALPWEILGADEASVDVEPLGLRTPLARQLRTKHSPPPVVTGRIVLTRALVIGDPLSGADHLPGAEQEAWAVAAALYEHGIPFDFLLGTLGTADPAKRWHARPATLANVLHHLLHEEYQLVHYAGHATFSDEDPQRGTGWMLADGLLTANHLTIVERLPPLVVANACHSSRVSTDLPGLADEFMGRGVRNLVGTARMVNDESARQFSDTFYAQLLGRQRSGPGDRGPTLGNAVLAGRRRLAVADLPDWDVYQLYGDPSFRYWPDVLGRDANDPAG